MSAPQPPSLDDGSRWAVILLGLLNCTWNLYTAGRAIKTTGAVSVIAFFHLWVFFAFSFPAVEMTYRYASLSLGFWRIYTDDPVLLEATLVLFVFQGIFFLALRGKIDATVSRLIRSNGHHWGQEKVGMALLVFLLPFLAARLLVLRQIGLSGAANAAVTRTDYFAQLDGGVSPIVWVLNAAFPVYAVVLACLAVKMLFHHPSAGGRWAYLVALVGCAGGVAISGGRAEIVFVAVTVGVFMYASGYRTIRHYAPVMGVCVLLAGFLFAVGQARHGQDNALSQAAGGVYVGDDYSGGDITQILGLGRFDAVVMILDKRESSGALDGASYANALVTGLDTTFLPQIAAGVDLRPPTVSGDVLGKWIFGSSINSALPSAPGEGYLNFGYLGVVLSALVIGLLTRALLVLAARIPGPPEAVLVLFSWTMARVLSDELGLMLTFVVRYWPILFVVLLVVGSLDRESSPRSRPSSVTEVAQ